MHVEHHDLYQEFPEFEDAITTLRTVNAHFATLFASYQSVTGRVENLEESNVPVGDFTMEDMKKQRVKLKDELYNMLLAYRAGQASVRA